MAVSKRKDQIGSLIREVETLTKGLRDALRKQAESLPKDIQKIADRLRKRAVMVAAQVEKYAHEVRVELEGEKKKAPAKRAARKRK